MLATRPNIPAMDTTNAARARAAFFANVCAYVAVNAVLVVVWFATRSAGDPFWPIWPLAIWGIGVVGQAWRTYRVTRDVAAGHPSA